nr:phosphotransferase family protein [Bacillus sp. Marseille-P3661]
MSLDLGKGWEVFPAGGATGEAYIAQFEGQKRLFLKRNSSPFLAVLSAEGIVPKLIWTKRMENGDVITAQHWLNGRELKPADMKNNVVAQLLSKIHRSKDLLYMLHKIGKTLLQPSDLLIELIGKVDSSLRNDPIITTALDYLKEELPYVHYDNPVVCHCDVNHNNWLFSDEQKLYLIDWDGAMIADPALDLGTLLYWYIPRDNWQDWLKHYGLDLTVELERRMKWYVIYQTIDSVIWLKNRNDTTQYRHWLQFLVEVIV